MNKKKKLAKSSSCGALSDLARKPESSAPFSRPDRLWRVLEERLQFREVLGGSRSHDGAADKHGPYEALRLTRKNREGEEGRAAGTRGQTGRERRQGGDRTAAGKGKGWSTTARERFAWHSKDGISVYNGGENDDSHTNKVINISTTTPTRLRGSPVQSRRPHLRTWDSGTSALLEINRIRTFTLNPYI